MPGYDWNKYNQTHYDYDNPPPKTVHGYKFNILYHDLIGECDEDRKCDLLCDSTTLLPRQYTAMNATHCTTISWASDAMSVTGHESVM